MKCHEDDTATIRPPSLLDALIPLVFMITMLIWSIVLFGIDAATGPLQVALLMSAVVAAVVAHKNGHSWERLGEEIVKGISLAMSAILILLMVGALIGVWNMSGTIATVVYYGIKYINPSWFYLAAAPPDRSYRHRDRQFLDDGGHAWGGICRHRQRDRRISGHNGGSSHLRRLFRRQDDPALGNDHFDARRSWAAMSTPTFAACPRPPYPRI